MNLTEALSLTYQAPGGATVAQSIAVNQATYSAQSGGTIDVPSGSPSGLAFPIPFGSVATPIGIAIIARAAAVGAYFNGATAGTALPLPTGGSIVAVAPRGMAGPGFTSAVIVSNGPAGAAGQVDYLVFGD